jgi:hypothetical protein
MKTPGFNAEASLYETSGRYQATIYGMAPTTGIVAQHWPSKIKAQGCPSVVTCIDACIGCDFSSSWDCIICNTCEACHGGLSRETPLPLIAERPV